MTSRSLQPRTVGSMPMLRFPFFWDLEEEGENQGFFQNTGLNVFEDDQNVYVEADMPGMKTEDIELTLDRGLLTIKGSRRVQEEKEDKKLKFHTRSTSSSSFFYRVAVPGQIDDNQEPKATYKDGVLQVTLKKARTGQTKRIQIQK